ncbi:hypothetical protein Pan258_57920 [Symmachiella dynata]|nr:hypothetical protein Pan258_57920 [Symmachiella dynata]
MNGLISNCTGHVFWRPRQFIMPMEAMNIASK